MKPLRLMLLAGFAMLLLSSCARVAYSEDAYSLARQQKLIAVMPPSITFLDLKNINRDTLRYIEYKESLRRQKDMHYFMQNARKYGDIKQDIQELDSTNARLSRAGYFGDYRYKVDICEALGVDGILTSEYVIPEYDASIDATELFLVTIPLTVLFGSDFKEWDHVDVTLFIKDCRNNKLIWRYKKKKYNSTNYLPDLVAEVMTRSSKKNPWFRKK